MFKNLLVPVLMCCTALVACGGGGNIQENLAAMDANNGGSPPPANDPSDEFETGEYLANWGLDTVNPVPAWEAGITGQGVVVAIIDSGIDDTHEDIDDNIHPNSSYTGDVGGQGTFIAGLIAGERNTTGTHGVAYDAQILAVQSGSTSDQIAASIDYAVANGADVINISIGEATVPNATLLTALENAALADIVVIFNAGDSNLSYTKTTVPTVIPNTPTQLAMTAILDIANGQFLIVGASNKGNTALFLQADRDPDENDPDWWDVHATNRAGETGSAYYLMAPGWDIYSTMAGGENLYEFRNDSAVAAPMVSAAAALLKQNFPNLTADEIVNILIKTATDITDARWVPDPDPLNPMGMVNTALPGADEYYGHGLLNIGAALAPIGTNSVVIKTESGWITTELADAGLVSGGVFGDGVGSGFARGAIFLDDYDRAYKTTFSSQILNASPFMDFDNRFDTAREYRHGNLALTPDLYISVAANYEVPVSTYEQDVFGLQDEDVVITDNVSVRLVKELGNKSAVSMAVGGSLSSVLSFGNHDTGYANSVSLSEGMNDPWISSNRSLNYADGQRIAIIHSLTDTLTLSVGLSSDIVASPDYFDSADFGADAERHVGKSVV